MPLVTASPLPSPASAASAAVLRMLRELTTSYVASDHVCTVGRERATLDFALAWVDSTSVEWYVEWSHDGVTWYRSLNYSAAAGVITATLNNATLANGASANWSDGPIVVQGAYMRVQVKKTAGTGADAVSVRVTLL